MEDWLKQHPSLHLLTIGIGIYVVSEAMWFVHNYVCDRIFHKPAEVSEVLMFNDLGFDCYYEHHKHSMDKDTVFKCRNEHCAERNVGRIVHFLNQAKYSVDLAMFTLSSLQITPALKDALKRGVIVRIITTHPTPSTLNSACTNLIKMGIPLRYPKSRKLMHHKFCVVDGRDRVAEIWRLKGRKYLHQEPTLPVVMNGSVNWTDNGFHSNWEYMVISSNPLMVNEFQSEFNRLWIAFGSKC